MASNPAFNQPFFCPTFLLSALFVTLAGTIHDRQVVWSSRCVKRICNSLHNGIWSTCSKETTGNNRVIWLNHSNGLIHCNYFTHIKNLPYNYMLAGLRQPYNIFLQLN